MAVLAVPTDAGQLDLEYQPDDVITFSEGLIGCPDWHEFLLVQDEDPGPAGVLQSVDDPLVALLVVDPEVIAPGYHAAVHQHAPTDSPGGGDPGPANQPAVLVTLTEQPDGSYTANLLGPLLIDPVSRQARQVVLDPARYSSRHPIDPAALNAGGA